MSIARFGVLLSVLTFVSMLILGIDFEEERTTFADLSFHLFAQATTGEIAIQNYRFVSAITQWLPTQLLSAEVDMKTVQLAYSLVFPIFYGSVWMFTHFVLKAKQWALAWALMWLTFASHAHFWIQSELPQGLAVFVLALGLMSYQPAKKWIQVLAKAALGFSIITVAFAHPLLFIPVTFCFGFLLITQRNDRIRILQVGVFYYVCFLIKAFVFRSPYDASAGGGLKVGLMSLLNFETPYSFPFFIETLASTYYLFFVVAIVGIWLLWKAGEKAATTLTVVALLGYCSLILLAYSTPETPEFYRENLLLPAGFMTASGFAFGLSQAKIERIAVIPSILLLTIISFRVLHIWWIGDAIYGIRNITFYSLLDTYKSEKVILKETPQLQENLIITWATGYEAWVRSARNKKPTQGFIIHENPEDVQWAIDDPRRLILRFHQPNFSELPGKYFIQPNKKQKYRLIK